MFGKDNSQTLITEPSGLVFGKYPIFKLGPVENYFQRGTKGELSNGLLKFTLIKVQKSGFGSDEIASIQIPIKGILESKKIKFSIPTWKILDTELRGDIENQMKKIYSLKQQKQGIEEKEYKKLKHFLSRYN